VPANFETWSNFEDKLMCGRIAFHEITKLQITILCSNSEFACYKAIQMRRIAALRNCQQTCRNMMKRWEVSVANPGIRANGDREVWVSGPGLPPKLRLRFFIMKSERRSQQSVAMAWECLRSSATTEDVHEGEPGFHRHDCNSIVMYCRSTFVF